MSLGVKLVLAVVGVAIYAGLLLFVAFSSDEQTMAKVVDMCSSEVVRMVEETQ